MNRIVRFLPVWNATLGEGSAIGCLLESEDFSLFERGLGLPEWLAHTVEEIFGGLGDKDRALFAVQVFEAIPVGTSIEHVRWQLAVNRLQALVEALRLKTQSYAKNCCEVIQQALDYCRCMTSDGAEQLSLDAISRLAKAAETIAREEYQKQSAIEAAQPWLARPLYLNPKAIARLAKDDAYAAANAVVAASRAIESSPSAAGKSVAAAGAAAFHLIGPTSAEHYMREARDLIAMLRETQ